MSIEVCDRVEIKTTERTRKIGANGRREIVEYIGYVRTDNDVKQAKEGEPPRETKKYEVRFDDGKIEDFMEDELERI